MIPWSKNGTKTKLQNYYYEVILNIIINNGVRQEAKLKCKHIMKHFFYPHDSPKKGNRSKFILTQTETDSKQQIRLNASEYTS